jgi:hypothetical protein
MEVLAWLVNTWFSGACITLIIGILFFWFDDLPLSETIFRIVAWPIFLVVLVVVGAKKSWQRYAR